MTYLQSTTQNSVLVATRQLDALGRTVKAKDWSNSQETQTDYDADSRLTQQRFFDGKDASKNYTLDYSYYDSTTDTTASTSGKGALAKVVLKPTATPASSTATVYSYDYWDSAQQKQITKVPVSGASGFTYLSYDASRSCPTCPPDPSTSRLLLNNPTPIPVTTATIVRLPRPTLDHRFSRLRSEGLGNVTFSCN